MKRSVHNNLADEGKYDMVDGIRSGLDREIVHVQLNLLLMVMFFIRKIAPALMNLIHGGMSMLLRQRLLVLVRKSINIL